MTGVFSNKSLFEASLKSKGVSITTAISGKTTHLLLGKTSVNEYGNKTGVGSSKYQAAMEKGLTVLKEREVLGILQGVMTEASLSEAKSQSKIIATKSSPLSIKIIFCVQECGEEKVSLARLKKELTARFEMKFDSTRSKNSLKKSLGQLVKEDSKLVKDGASYKLPDPTIDGVDNTENNIPELPTMDTIEFSAEDRENARQAETETLCPEEGRWRGLRVVSSKKSKSGRAKCMQCQQMISKGDTQVQVCDDSLFKMLVFAGDHHEGVSRGYVECGYPNGYDVVSRKTFHLHQGCLDTADMTYRSKFDSDWRNIRQHVIRDVVRDDQV